MAGPGVGKWDRKLIIRVTTITDSKYLSHTKQGVIAVTHKVEKPHSKPTSCSMPLTRVSNNRVLCSILVFSPMRCWTCCLRKFCSLTSMFWSLRKSLSRFMMSSMISFRVSLLSSTA